MSPIPLPILDTLGRNEQILAGESRSDFFRKKNIKDEFLAILLVDLVFQKNPMI